MKLYLRGSGPSPTRMTILTREVFPFLDVFDGFQLQLQEYRDGCKSVQKQEPRQTFNEVVN